MAETSELYEQKTGVYLLTFHGFGGATGTAGSRLVNELERRDKVSVSKVLIINPERIPHPLLSSRLHSTNGGFALQSATRRQ